MPDKAASSLAAGGRALLAVILMLVILAPVGYSVFARITAKGGEPPEPPDPRYSECVADIQYMRFHHWELLRGLREEVVRFGTRGDISLDGCWNCHQSKVRFCDRCHKAASVFPDCFGCHYYPDLDETQLPSRQLSGGPEAAGSEPVSER